jgi:hypothetical protein
MNLEPRDSPSIELGRILDDLDRTRRRALLRSEALQAHVDVTSDLHLLAPLQDAPAVAHPTGTGPDVAVPTAAVPDVAVPVAPSGLEVPRTADLVMARLRAAARPVSTVVLTTTLVLAAWLLVLEPALGSRPVLVLDDGMSPALRIGDVAFAEEPTGPLVSGSIVAVRIDGRVEVSRLIDRGPAPTGPSTDGRAGAPLVVRDDADGLEVRDTVARDELIGVIGAAVPRVGLPVVWLRSPSTAPLGTLAVLLLLGVSAVGVLDTVRERAAREKGVRPAA